MQDDPQVRIRPATAEDRPALIRQFLALNLHEDAIMGDRRRDLEGAVEALQVVEAEVERTNGAVLVAECDGRVIGHMVLTFIDGPVYLRPERRAHAYVKELYVHEEMRGRGLGQRLLHEAERIARQRGYRRLMLSVVAGNEIALRAYARFGLVPNSLDLVKELGE